MNMAGVKWLAPNIDGTALLIAIRCTGLRKSGRLCGHIVAKIPTDTWEQVIIDEIEIECASCGTIAKFADWR